MNSTLTTLFRDPYCDASQQQLSDAMALYISDNIPIDVTLGLRPGPLSPRRQWLQGRKGALIVIAWFALQETLTPRIAADTLYDYLNQIKQPPDELSEPISELIELSTQLNSKLTSKRGFYQRLRHVQASTQT